MGLDLLRVARLCALPSICTIHLTQTASYLRAELAGNSPLAGIQ